MNIEADTEIQSWDLQIGSQVRDYNWGNNHIIEQSIDHPENDCSPHAALTLETRVLVLDPGQGGNCSANAPVTPLPLTWTLIIVLLLVASEFAPEMTAFSLAAPPRYRLSLAGDL